MNARIPTPPFALISRFKTIFAGLALGVCSSVTLGACDDDGGGGACTPGETQACVCADGDGAQSCDDEGTWGSCSCGASAGDGTGPGDDGGAGDDGGPAGDDADSADNGSEGDDGGDDSPAQCDGDWSLTSSPFVGETFIGECDGSPPTNCLTGHSITFSDGECWCLPSCGDAGLSEGDACVDDGSITCTYIESSNGNNSGVFCVPPEWGLCGG